MKKTIFIKNAAVLTASSLLLRFIGIIFKVWLAGKIGSEGIGLYQVVFSVYVLASTFATSGICTAVTRLCADELAVGSENGVKKILKRSITLTLILALITLAALFFGADFIANTFLGDSRAALAIKTLSFSLPFMAVSSCIKGYFFARRRATPNALTQLIEQGVRIGVIAVYIKLFEGKGLAYTCAAVLLGDTVAEGAALLILYLIYLADRKRLATLSGRASPPFSVLKEISRIALPITLGRYLNSLLRTAENILVPKTLSRYQGSSAEALSQFGMIKGMALPILFFPSTLLNALSTLLIPEMSSALAMGRKGLVKYGTQRILQLTGLVSFVFSAIFFVAGRQIGQVIYRSEDVGILIKLLAPLVPLMYLDSIADGILKGLDQQNFTFITAVSDSALRIVFILLILGNRGLLGFIGIMYFSNIYTCFLHVGRLIKLSGANIKFVKQIFLPLMFAYFLALCFDTVLSSFALPDLVYIILLCALSGISYFAYLLLTKTVTVDDIKDMMK
ncbi:MAG: oligosaccharide flippase family protein [Clostridia bacterium]|nr:oligosaccharide flippase family protein [Clostridia bacterium]